MDEALKDDGVEILKLRDGFFRSLEQFLHFFDIDLRRRIVLMPHHLLHLSGIGIIEQGKGWSRMAQTMHDNARLLHAGQEQPFGNDAMNRSGTQRPLGVASPRFLRDRSRPYLQRAYHFPSVVPIVLGHTNV